MKVYIAFEYENIPDGPYQNLLGVYTSKKLAEKGVKKYRKKLEKKLEKMFLNPELPKDYNEEDIEQFKLNYLNRDYDIMETKLIDEV